MCPPWGWGPVYQQLLTPSYPLGWTPGKTSWYSGPLTMSMRNQGSLDLSICMFIRGPLSLNKSAMKWLLRNTLIFLLVSAIKRTTDLFKMYRGEPLWGSQWTRASCSCILFLHLASWWCFFLPSWSCEMLNWGHGQRQLYVHKHFLFFCMSIFLNRGSRDSSGMYTFTWALRESFPSKKD